MICIDLWLRLSNVITVGFILRLDDKRSSYLVFPLWPIHIFSILVKWFDVIVKMSKCGKIYDFGKGVTPSVPTTCTRSPFKGQLRPLRGTSRRLRSKETKFWVNLGEEGETGIKTITLSNLETYQTEEL